VRVDINPAGHGRPHVFEGRRVADACRMVVDQVALKLPHLIIGQDDF
jgi:hypothetical protein